jgi:DEAD/DEAH box helicase domain-containing protein
VTPPDPHLHSWATGLLDDLTVARGRDDRLTHVELLAPRLARSAAWPEWTPSAVRRAFAERGVEQPWTHQVEAAEAAWAGEHVVVSTGTASGKSLAFQLPALAAVEAARGERGQRGATVLYVAPTKALAHDQWASLRSLGLDVRLSTHDGDSSREERDWTRDHAEYVLTNPDMLHRSLLPAHEHWSRFFATLRFVVVDEAHHYRGVFGAHVSQVLRRLRRVCARYGAHPTFVLASATMSEPEVTAARLVGMPVTAVTEDGSPRGRVALALWEPPFASYLGENGAPVRRPAGAEAADLLTDLVIHDVRTLAFVRSRRGVEQVARTTAELLEEVDPSLAGRVAAYRGGYLPEERRELEEQLRRGDLVGLAATNALELGIDISGLDAVLMVGFPAALATPSGCWSRATTRSTPTSSTTPRRSSAGLSRPPSSTPTTPTCSARTCARRPRNSR